MHRWPHDVEGAHFFYPSWWFWGMTSRFFLSAQSAELACWLNFLTWERFEKSQLADASGCFGPKWRVLKCFKKGERDWANITWPRVGQSVRAASSQVNTHTLSSICETQCPLTGMSFSSQFIFYSTADLSLWARSSLPLVLDAAESGDEKFLCILIHMLHLLKSLLKKSPLVCCVYLRILFSVVLCGPSSLVASRLAPPMHFSLKGRQAQLFLLC